MKSIAEIQEILAAELNQYIASTGKPTHPGRYLNEFLGNTSSALVALLSRHLEKTGWYPGHWMDDSLITDISLETDRLFLEGIAIWGTGGSTEQWTEPLYFEVRVKDKLVDMAKYTFLFGEEGRPAIAYGRFRDDRDIWLADERKWRDVIHGKSIG